MRYRYRAAGALIALCWASLCSVQARVDRGPEAEQEQELLDYLEKDLEFEVRSFLEQQGARGNSRVRPVCPKGKGLSSQCTCSRVVRCLESSESAEESERVGADMQGSFSYTATPEELNELASKFHESLGDVKGMRRELSTFSNALMVGIPTLAALLCLALVVAPRSGNTGNASGGS